MPQLLLAALLLAASGCSPAPAAMPLDGCRIVDEIKGRFALSCAGVLLSALDGDQSQSDAFIEGVETSVSDNAHGPVTQEATTLVIAGSHRNARRLATKDRIVLLLVDARGSRVRTMACASAIGDETSCPRLLATVWPWEFAEGPPASIPRNIERLIAGRKIDVPPGCSISTAPGYGSMRCPDQSVLTWQSLAPTAPNPAGNWTEGSPGSSKRQCVVESVAATCVFTPFEFSAVVRARVSVRETSLAVSCQSVRASGGIPQACASVFAFDPPAAWPR